MIERAFANATQLMQEANMRIIDVRHTLPNLKALLLTLSSPTLPPPLPVSVSTASKSSGTSTYVNSRATSRQASHSFGQPWLRAGAGAGAGPGTLSVAPSSPPTSVDGRSPYARSSLGGAGDRRVSAAAAAAAVRMRAGSPDLRKELGRMGGMGTVTGVGAGAGYGMGLGLGLGLPGEKAGEESEDGEATEYSGREWDGSELH